jgi:hypothetical protein
MCSMTFNEDAKRLEVQQRVFYDDLEKALRFRLDDPKFDILNPSGSSMNYDSLFMEYINDHIDLNINDKEVELSMLEYEISDDAMVLYMYKSNVKSIEKVEILSHLLFEIFSDQDNVVSINAYQKKKSERFNISSKPVEITFSRS